MLCQITNFVEHWKGRKNVHCSPADGTSRVPHYKNGVSDIRIPAVPDDIFSLKNESIFQIAHGNSICDIYYYLSLKMYVQRFQKITKMNFCALVMTS